MSDSEDHDPIRDENGVDWTEKVYDWTELYEGPGRADRVSSAAARIYIGAVASADAHVWNPVHVGG